MDAVTVTQKVKAKKITYKTSVKIGDKTYKLIRLHSKLSELIVWEVIEMKDKVQIFRVGIVRQYRDHYLQKQIGVQIFPVMYWVGSRFYPQGHVIDHSRKGCIMKLIAYKGE